MAGIDSGTGGQLAPSPYTSGLSGYPFFDWMVRNQIIPMVIDGRNNDCPLLGRLHARVKKVAGKFVVRPVRDGRNWAGISAIHSEGNLPDPGRQGGYNYASAVRDIYARAKFSGKMLRLQNMQDARFADYLEYEIGGLKDDLALKQEFMMHNDGTGKRAELAVALAASDTMTVRLNQDLEGISTCTSPTNLYLDVGMRVALVAADGTVRAGAGTSAGLNALYIHSKVGTTGVKLSATLGGAAIADLNTNGWAGDVVGDWIVDASRDSSNSSPTYADTGFKAEPMGLEGIFRDVGVLDGMAISTAGQQTGAQDFTGLTSTTAAGTGFQGVPCNSAFTTYSVPSWNRAIVADGGGALRPIDDILLQRALSDSRRINNGMVKEFWSSHELYDSYVATLFGDKRFNTTSLSGGHSGDSKEMGGANFNGIPWYKSRWMLKNRLIGLDPEMLSIYENEPLGVCAPPGNPQYERLHDKDQFWMALSTSYQMFDELRDRSGFILVDVE